MQIPLEDFVKLAPLNDSLTVRATQNAKDNSCALQF
jgi:hypothetical protein